MKAALTIWDGRISPVFDVSREALVVTIEDGVVSARTIENIAAPTGALKIGRLEGLGVKTLICGAISEPLRRDLIAKGITVLAFVAGEVEEVLQALSRGALPAPELSMPGCGGRKRRFRRRGGGRGAPLHGGGSEPPPGEKT